MFLWGLAKKISRKTCSGLLFTCKKTGSNTSLFFLTPPNKRFMDSQTSFIQKTGCTPGVVSLGIGEEDFEKDVFRLLFTCKKNGLDFLGQLRLDAREGKVDIEMFNEGYFEFFEDDKHHVMLSLAEKTLSGLWKHGIVPEKFRELGRDHLTYLKESVEPVIQPPEEAAQEETGEVDLQKIFDRLNQEYFGGKLDAGIEWGRETKTPNRRSFRFGSYDSKRNLIRIHPRLNQDFVPLCVLELTVHHEMCHQACPPVKRGGQWQTHHQDFKKKEREYRHFKEAVKWEKTHWAKLLAPAPVA